MILQVAVFVPLNKAYFDYLLPDTINQSAVKIGMRVNVPFGRQKLIGMIIGISTHSDYDEKKLKKISAVLDDEPLLPKTLLTLCQWASLYYHHPLGEVIAGALPTQLRRGKKANMSFKKKQENSAREPVPPLILSEVQQHAVDTITQSASQFSVFLLNGVTGSGKTQVYLDSIQAIIKRGLQALVLVPEIALTPQIISRFENYFTEKVVAFHSGFNDSERSSAWLSAKNGEAKIIIGTRSAVFIPLKNPGLIIIDEEHDTSFKQQEGFRYSARDVAIIRAKQELIPIVLGSATPALESFYNVKRGRYHQLILPTRAGTSIQPSYRLIDCRTTVMEQGMSPLALQAIASHLGDNNQVLIFLNRRGFSPVMMCHQCGWSARCPRCDVNYTYHQADNRLRCHHCDKQTIAFTVCPDCHHKTLDAVGVGTERLQRALEKHFPGTGIVRIDRDTTRKKNSLDDMLKKIHNNHASILLGTQMLAKGHHFPNVTLVVIVNVDNGLFSNDFRAIERMGQLIVQVAGRAGRAEKPGEVLLQTRHPDHPLLQQLTHEPYTQFADSLLNEREKAGLPPFGFLAVVRADSMSQDKPLLFLETLKKQMQASMQLGVAVLGPVPSPMPRRAGRFRAQLLLHALQRHALHKLLAQLNEVGALSPHARHVRWSIDIDPTDIF